MRPPGRVLTLVFPNNALRRAHRAIVTIRNADQSIEERRKSSGGQADTKPGVLGVPVRRSGLALAGPTRGRDYGSRSEGLAEAIGRAVPPMIPSSLFCRHVRRSMEWSPDMLRRGLRTMPLA